MKYVVVIGSTGRLGRMIRANWHALDPEWPFKVFYQTRRPQSQPYTEGDLIWSPQAGPQAFRRVLSSAIGASLSERVEGTMVVLAGVTPSSTGSLDENTGIVRACLQAALSTGIQRILVASTSAVYGALASKPLHEDEPLMATSQYGMEKRRVEQLCASPEWGDLDISLLRIGNVAGADALILNHAKNRNERLSLDVFGNGKSVLRSYIGPETLAKVLQSLIETQRPLPKEMNISAPSPIYMDDLAQAAGIKWRPRPAPTELRQSITLDTTRLEALHHFDPCDSDPHMMVHQMKKLGL